MDRTRDRLDDAELLAVARRVRAAFPLAPVPACVDGRIAERLRGEDSKTLVWRSQAVRAISLLVALLAGLVVGLAVLLPPATPTARETVPVMADTTSLYTPGFRPDMPCVPTARFLPDLAAASVAAGYEVLEPADTLGRTRLWIQDEVPAGHEPTAGIGLMQIDYGDFHLAQLREPTAADAAEDVRRMPVANGGLHPGFDKWVDISGHDGYAFGKIDDRRPGGIACGGSGVIWSDGRVRYGVSSTTLTVEQLLRIARSVPSR
jgi:hypothetical protein